MPRHRLHGRPESRAQRQGKRPERGAPPDAVPPTTAQATGDRLRRLLARPRTLTAGPEYGRMVRNAMLTPWLAVSVGIVVAASLTLATPHAALTFPPTSRGRCPQACRSSGPGSSEPLPTTTRAVRMHISGRSYVSTRQSPIKVEYEILPRKGRQFAAVIVLISHKALGKWDLRFSLPGIRIGSVMWASWQPDGAGGVVIEGSPLPWPRSGANEARIVLFGTGQPQRPRHCVIDHARCTFRALAD